MTRYDSHPTADRFQAYVEKTLGAGDRTDLDAHLETCARCRSELASWGQLFEDLGELPHFEPAAGFTERVMAGVRIRQPFRARVLAWLQGLVPQSAPGWVLVLGILALPLLTMGGAVAWIFNRSWLTPQAIWIYLSQRTVEVAGSAVRGAASFIGESGPGTWALENAATLVATGPAQLTLGAVLFGLLTIISAWVLYTNLVGSSTREHHYVSLSI